MKFLLSVLTMMLLVVGASAQETLEGRVYELHTRIPLTAITIRNHTNGKTTHTDSTGWFQLPVKTNDLLILSGFAYQPDTILVIDHRYREVFLSPMAHLLKEVKVSSAPVNIGDFRDPEFRGQKVVYQRDENGHYKGGIAIRLSYWKKDSKKERRSQKRLKKAELEAEIASVFSPFNVGKIIPLRGQQLQDFIDLFRPSVEVYKSPRYHFIHYLNQKYKEYLSLPEGQRKLPSLTGQPPV